MSPPPSTRSEWETRRLKAVALSALVLPGSGQLHLGARWRGYALIAATAWLLWRFARGVFDMAVDAASTAPVDFDLAEAWRHSWAVAERHEPVLAPVMLGLAAVWLFGIFDAWLARGIAKPEASGDTVQRPTSGGGHA